MNLSEIASVSALIKQELAPLAEKLGQGAEYTFGLFVKQAYVNAFTGLLWWGMGIPLLLGGAWCLGKTQDKNTDDTMTYYIFGVMSLGIAFFALALPVNDIIQVMVNPEYQAIRLILETIKTK